ncbi:MAG: cytochrome c family protein [Alphaproteobacteria bacterium]|nr:cytochrome c family protein [Alphaproteobacteria bacterium]MBV8548727.1 cytochrome c family protein [Alphaproteobacteria bacterium]
MNGFEFNKIMAAVIAALLIGNLANFIAHKVVSPTMLEKNVYVVEGVGAVGTAQAATAAPAGPAPIEPLLAKADIAAGQKTARVCGTCHSFNKGEAAKIGPNLYGVIGGPHAHQEGYSYSDGMTALKGKVWDFAALNEFLFAPRNTVSGTKMSFAGLKNDQDRANVIAWLNTQSDKPLALPK